MLYLLCFLGGIGGGIAGTLSSQKIISWLKAEETKGVAALKADITSLTSKL